MYKESKQSKEYTRLIQQLHFTLSMLDSMIAYYEIEHSQELYFFISGLKTLKLSLQLLLEQMTSFGEAIYKCNYPVYEELL